MEIRDAQIAGIAAARRATLTTRNASHFADLGMRGPVLRAQPAASGLTWRTPGKRAKS